MGDSVDVKALRARFNNSASDTSSRDSSSPKSPRPGFGRAIPPAVESRELALYKLSPTIPPPVASPGLGKIQREEQVAAPIPPRTAFVPQLPPNPGVRASLQPTDCSKIKKTGEMLLNRMQRYQGLAVTKPPLPPPAPTSNPLQRRNQPRQRSTGDVTPLRRPLPRDGPLPLKPKRPPNVNLEPFLRFVRGAPPLPGPRRTNGSPASAGRDISLPGMTRPPKPPQRTSKPTMPPRMASVDIDDDQDTYDDITTFDNNGSRSDHSSRCIDEGDNEVYEFIDEGHEEVNPVNPEKNNRKGEKRQQKKEMKEQIELQKREYELRKKFQLQGEVEVLHTARVRHDWHGGSKLDLSVRQGDSVDILRVRNNPGGKWLARSLNGNYGYISNTCVDVDYEAVKLKVLQSRKSGTSPLPPPPPDPPQMASIEPTHRDSASQDDDDYDDVQAIMDDFPPPPPEINFQHKMEKELRKKFGFDGPVKVLHTAMVDPHSVIKKPGGKYLPVTQGDILDVIQLTNSRKALCYNPTRGKYGYVPRNLLLPPEGDTYDDVDYIGDVHDNDSLHDY
ncbi:FYN-binding protein 1 isoform 2-T2 [Aulostomus maculatus]